MRLAQQIIISCQRHKMNADLFRYTQVANKIPKNSSCDWSCGHSTPPKKSKYIVNLQTKSPSCGEPPKNHHNFFVASIFVPTQTRHRPEVIWILRKILRMTSDGINGFAPRSEAILINGDMCQGRSTPYILRETQHTPGAYPRHPQTPK